MFAAVLGAGSGAAAKDQPKPQDKGAQELQKGLDAMMASAQAGPPAKTTDKDQGDDNASDRAKDVVCNKDTPAARRSAICPVPISP